MKGAAVVVFVMQVERTILMVASPRQACGKKKWATDDAAAVNECHEAPRAAGRIESIRAAKRAGRLGEGGAHAVYQIAEVKRLGDVIIGPSFEGFSLVVSVVANGQH
jgi:hypothetical protein